MAETKARTPQTKTPPLATDATEGLIEFDVKAIEEFNQKAIDDSKKAIEDFKKGVEEFNEKAIEDRKQAWAAYIDTYEKAVLTAADLHEQSARATDIEWVKNIVAAQARATRELTKAYVNAARELDA